MESKTLIKSESKLSQFKLLFIYFCIYAFVGWIMETLYVSNLKGHLVKRGFLLGPICPIYGFGAIMLITILGKYKKQPAKLFFYTIIIFSPCQYFTYIFIIFYFVSRLKRANIPYNAVYPCVTSSTATQGH